MRFLVLLFTFQAWAGEPVCVKAASTLRKGPGTQHPASWRVSKYMPFLTVERKGGWTKVQDLDGETHWAKGSDLTNKIRCVVVKTNIATLRREPSPSAAPIELKTVDRYTPFKRLENNREWMQVEDETGRQAWVHESQVWKPVNIQSISF